MAAARTDSPQPQQKEQDLLSVAFSPVGAFESSEADSDCDPGTHADRSAAEQREPLDTCGQPVGTAASDPGPPPDGGFHAWTQVAAAHLIIFCTWGYINSFGVFQTYYSSLQLGAKGSNGASNGPSDADIAWIGSVQIFLLMAIGTFSGRATDAGFFHVCVGSGMVLQLLGVFLSSLCSQYWQLLLTQGFAVGLGNGLLFCPTIALIPTYFTRRRSLALAITSSGSGTGGLLFPGVIEVLLPRIGFGWTVRVVGLVMLVLHGVAILLARTRLPPRRSGPVVDVQAFAELPYALMAGGLFFAFWGLYCAFYFVGEYAVTTLGTPPLTSIHLLLVMNGVGIPTRWLLGYLADRVTGPTNLLAPCAALGGILLYVWIAVKDIPGLFVFAAVYGFAAAAVQGLFPPAVSGLTSDMKRMGTRMGMILTILSFAVLTGSPIAGALIQAAGGRYVAAQVFSGSVMVLGALAIAGSRVAMSGWKLAYKM